MLVWGVIAAIVIFVGIKMLKPKYNEYKLEQKLEQVILRQGYPDSDSLRKEVMELAGDEQLPLDPEKIIIIRGGNSTTIRVTMDQEVNLIVTKYVVHTEIEKVAHSW